MIPKVGATAPWGVLRTGQGCRKISHIIYCVFSTTFTISLTSPLTFFMFSHKSKQFAGCYGITTHFPRVFSTCSVFIRASDRKLNRVQRNADTAQPFTSYVCDTAPSSLPVSAVTPTDCDLSHQHQLQAHFSH